MLKLSMYDVIRVRRASSQMWLLAELSRASIAESFDMFNATQVLEILICRPQLQASLGGRPYLDLVSNHCFHIWHGIP